MKQAMCGAATDETTATTSDIDGGAGLRTAELPYEGQALRPIVLSTPRRRYEQGDGHELLGGDNRRAAGGVTRGDGHVRGW